MRAKRAAYREREQGGVDAAGRPTLELPEHILVLLTQGHNYHSESLTVCSHGSMESLSSAGTSHICSCLKMGMRGDVCPSPLLLPRLTFTWNMVEVHRKTDTSTILQHGLPLLSCLADLN